MEGVVLLKLKLQEVSEIISQRLSTLELFDLLYYGFNLNFEDFKKYLLENNKTFWTYSEDQVVYNYYQNGKCDKQQYISIQQSKGNQRILKRV